jgi:hypothetical protein
MKQSKLFRFTPDTIRRLKDAAEKAGMSETVYVELALKDRLKKDGIS